MKLAILMPTLVERRALRLRALTELRAQADRLGLTEQQFQILTDLDDGTRTIGHKRNALMKAAGLWGATYVAHHDDDDLAGDNYLERIWEGMLTGADCCSLKGQLYWRGVPEKPFLHSLDYEGWSEDDQCYYRCPNHLNAVKLEKVERFAFPDWSNQEDGMWSMAVQRAGALKTEFKIDDVIYHYFCGQPKFRR